MDGAKFPNVHRHIFTTLMVLSICGSDGAHAGGYLFAENNGINIITHPTGYNGSDGTLTINVCIADNEHTSDMLQSVKNIINVWNQRLPTTGNVRRWEIPSDQYDFESVALHELGHCIGESHVNLASESGQTGSNQNYTKARVGENGGYDLDPGVDGVIGSSDDDRGDDVNLHWYRIANNNPFTIDYDVVDSTTYQRDTAYLPDGHNFVVNADYSVGPSLGTLSTEAVMQQGTYNGEIQRTLTPDDVATLKLAQSGLNETLGGGDDYEINLVLATSNCDINLTMTNIAGLAYCSVGGQYLSANHLRITEANIFFDSEINWYFNKNRPCSDTRSLDQNVWTLISLPCSTEITEEDTVIEIFGDDLGQGYMSTWAMIEQAGLTYRFLDSDDVLKTGQAYWIATMESGKSITVEGEYNASPDILLDTTAGAEYPIVGHPFEFSVDWGDVQIVHGADVHTLGEAITHGDITGTFHVWTGSSSETYNASTPGMNGNLQSFMGFGVRTLKSDLRLRIPAEEAASLSEELQGQSVGASSAKTASPALAPSDVADDGTWYVRVIASSAEHEDRGNVFGQFGEARDGRDQHDLEELPPFDGSYLTVVFPHEEWNAEEWQFTSDFHAVTRKPEGEWIFEVLSSPDVQEVTLRFDGPNEILKKGKLWDLESNRKVKFSKDSYTFQPTSQQHRFRFRLGNPR